MANWSKKKVEPSQINKGQEYTKDDNVSVEELNAIVNNSFNSQTQAEQSLNTVKGFEIGNVIPGEVASASIVVDEKNEKIILNLVLPRGEQGETGETGSIEIDSKLDATSENPVANKVIYFEIKKKLDVEDAKDFLKSEDLGSLAFKDSVSASDVGLGNVDNTRDLDKPISRATQNALDSKLNSSAINGMITYKGETTSDKVNELVTRVGDFAYLTDEDKYILLVDGEDSDTKIYKYMLSNDTKFYNELAKYTLKKDFDDLKANRTNIANTNQGGSIGTNAKAGSGFAGGWNAESGDGVAVGKDAKTKNGDVLVDAIQLGSGTNTTNKTLQVYDDNIYDASTHTGKFKKVSLDGKDLQSELDKKQDNLTIDSSLNSTSNNPIMNSAVTKEINKKLDATSYVVDDELDSTSNNPIANKVVTSINAKVDNKPDKWNVVHHGEFYMDDDYYLWFELYNETNEQRTIQYVNLADKMATIDFVNSSIATATATFRGTHNSVNELPTTGVDLNDYAFVVVTDNLGNRVFKRYKYSDGKWEFEYDLNNSSFTEAQWSAINSGITESLKNKITTNESNITKLQSDKEDKANLKALAYKDSLTKGDVGLGNVNNTSDANKPISTATQNALNLKADKNELPQVVTTAKNGLMIADDKIKLDGIKNGAEPNVQADWNETNMESDRYIRNKPSYDSWILGEFEKTSNLYFTPANEFSIKLGELDNIGANIMRVGTLDNSYVLKMEAGKKYTLSFDAYLDDGYADDIVSDWVNRIRLDGIGIESDSSSHSIFKLNVEKYAIGVGYQNQTHVSFSFDAPINVLDNSKTLYFGFRRYYGESASGYPNENLVVHITNVMLNEGETELSYSTPFGDLLWTRDLVGLYPRMEDIVDKSQVATQISVNLNTTDYKLTMSLLNYANQSISSKVIDFPLESMVVDIDYLSSTKEIQLTLQNGTTTSFSVADLVSGLATQSALNTTNTNVSNLTTRVGTAETNITNLQNSKANSSDLSKYLPLSGGTMEGDINLSTNKGFNATTTSGNVYDIFRVNSSNRKLTVGGSYPALELKGLNARPTYNSVEMPLTTDKPYQFAEEEYEKSYNLWNEEEKGSIDESTGVDIYNATRWRTKGYIEAKPNAQYTLSATVSSNIYFIFYFYTSNKTFISSNAKVGTSNTMTTPNNCAYIRCVVADTTSTSSSNRQLTRSDVVLPYEPYNPNRHITNSEAEFLRVENNKSLNLFDKNNYNVLDDAYITNSDIQGSTGVKTVYIPCNPNTTYYVYKNNSARFKVSTTNGVPAIWTSLTTTPIEIINSKEARQKITITTSANSHYLVIYLYHTTDTLSFEEIISSLGIYTSKINGEIVHKNETEQIFLQNEFSKSKNLFNGNLQLGAWVFADGNYTWTSEYYCSTNYIDVVPGSTITLSAKGNYTVGGSGFVFYNNGSYVGYADHTFTATVPANANQVLFNIFIGSNTFNLTDIQLEYGATSTPYQAYNSNKHITNQQADFLKKENEKNLNLSSVGSTNLWNFDIAYVEAGKTYSLSLNIDGYISFAVRSRDANATYLSTNYDKTGYTTATFVANYTGLIYINSWTSTLGTFNSYSNIMLVEGSTPMPYQPYNGEIIHRGDIEPVLLWENGNLNAPFVAQEITFNKSVANYKYIIVEVLGTYYGDKQPRTIEKFLSLKQDFEIILFGIYQVNGSVFSRNIYIQTGGKSAHVYPCYGASNQNNNACIPAKIYGSNY